MIFPNPTWIHHGSTLNWYVQKEMRISGTQEFDDIGFQRRSWMVACRMNTHQKDPDAMRRLHFCLVRRGQFPVCSLRVPSRVRALPSKMDSRRGEGVLWDEPKRYGRTVTGTLNCIFKRHAGGHERP